MIASLPRLERAAAAALALLFALLALYGCWSAPDIAARWGVSVTGVVLFAAWGVVASWAVATAVRQPTASAWIAFAGVALALRLVSMTLTAGRVSPSDPHWYLELARHLLAGQGLFLDDPAMGVRAYAEFPPAYPLVLAAWGWLFGLAAPSILALSTLLDFGAAMLIARLGERLGERRAGRAAAALYLIWPSVLFNAPLAQKESLELLLVLALAHGWLGAGQRPIWRSAWVVGLPAAMLALTQPGMAALAALIGIALAPRLGWRRFVAVAMAAAAVSVAAMLPWWFRNWHLFHAFVPLTSVGGLSLWIGENPDATGNWMPYPAAIVGLPELEVAHRAGRIAIEWMTQHPIDMMRLNLAKFLRAAGVGQFAITRLDAMTPALPLGTTAALSPLAHGSHVLMLGAGAASLFVRRRSALTALLLATAAQMMLFGIWFEFGERHRELMTPLLLLSVTIGVRSAVQLATRHEFTLRTVPAAASSARREA